MPENWTVWKSNNQGVKEETFIEAGRRGGDGQPDCRRRNKVEDWVIRHLRADEPGRTGEQDRLHNPGQVNTASKPLAVKTCGNPRLTGEIVLQTHRVLECTQAHSPGNQPQKGPICLWVVGEVTKSWPRDKPAALFLLGPLPHIQHHDATMWVTPPWPIPKAPPLITSQVLQDKQIWPKWKNRLKL